MLISELRDKLEDEKSRIIFDARINYRHDSRLSEFYNNIRNLGDVYSYREIDDFISNTGISNLYIWGSDDPSIYSYNVLKDAGYKVEGLIVKDISKTKCFDLPYFLYKKLIYEEMKNSGIIVFERDLKDVPREILDYKNVLKLFSHVVGRTGDQYFDFFKPCDMEYFLDAGCLDGATTKKFLHWCNERYGAVYAFEANPIVIPECKKNMECYVESDRLLFFDCALWDKKDQVKFTNTGSKWDAHIDLEGEIQVDANSIDNLLEDKKITFIKLDVEGSELKVLYGAKKTIMLHHPRMAISVYHNQDDLINIMKYLIGLKEDYHFSLRHYHTDNIETVLYVY